MKKINRKLSITAMLILGVVGVLNIKCSDDVLTQVNPNVVTPSTFWQTGDDAKKGIIGAYAPFTNIWYYTRFEIFASDYRDDLINGFNISERTALGRFGGTPGANGTIWVWRAMFQGVNRANEVIFHVPGIPTDPEFSEQDRDNIVGEGYFIRAFNYFNLLNNWLNVPLIVDPISEIDRPSEILQAPPADVWAQIEADLQQAQQLLPASWSGEELGRVTSGAATGMLGKVYLYQGKYAEAKAEFDKVMNGTYQLMDNYAHNFTEEFENNAESLFEIQFTADGLNGWGADNSNSRKAAAYTMDLAPQGFTGQDGFRINDWALALFLDERTVNNEIDPRAYATLFWDNDETTTYEGNVLASRTYGNRTWDEAYPSGDTNIYANKWLDWEFRGYAEASFNNSGNNFRVLRYADILLMYAEAEFMLNGSTQSALDAINEVRARVDMPAFASITMQDIEDERIKELSFEKTRYYDLLRWGNVVTRIVNNPEFKSESGGTDAYQPGREYIAIPQNELDRNINFKQNQGYSN